MPRYAALCAACLALAGCPPKTPQTEPMAAGPIHPDLQCPPGTMPAGAAPPVGLEVWCQKPSTNGTTWLRHGPVISWHSNEQRRLEGAYLEGKETGAWLYWYPTGTPQQQGSYTMGVRDGVWTSYHPDGERASEGQYVDGSEHGPWVYWNADLLTRTEGEYVLGERDGTWVDYGPDEQPVRERLYRSGRLVSVTGQ